MQPKYSVNQHTVSILLGWVQAKTIAIPEIQRPFVWESVKVRDLMDSLYKGYPVGYIITWKNPDTKLKDGSMSSGKKIIIDGQQRIMAMRAAILGLKVVNSSYKEVRVVISFNPVTEEFATRTPSIQNNTLWIDDISEILGKDGNLLTFVRDYQKKNPEVDENIIVSNVQKLIDIKNRQIGVIDLEESLDIETITDIFVRINSKGVKLSQADFVMSKIAANEIHGGALLRKAIDYFSHSIQDPSFVRDIPELDANFAKTNYYQKFTWLSNANVDIYVPDYTDIIRVAFLSEFKRGKLSDLVSLLSGRNFETRVYEDEISRDSFEKLSNGVLSFVSQTEYERFIMILRSTGYIDKSMIRSQSVLNFAYAIYLILRAENFNPAEIETYVRKWLVMSILTRRYSGSAETAFEYDIKRVVNGGIREYLKEIEQGSLSEAFWNTTLVRDLETAVLSSPFFNIFLAAQVKSHDKGFLSKEITVSDLIQHRGDIHHIFPRDYLKKLGREKNDYNQIANYVYMQSEINIKIGNKSPKEYFGDIQAQIGTDTLLYGGIVERSSLIENLSMCCIPEDVMEMEITNYEEFLSKRRVLIAQKIKEYYFKL